MRLNTLSPGIQLPYSKEERNSQSLSFLPNFTLMIGLAMFSSEKQFLILPTNDPETITRIEQVLSQTRFRVIRTFDLQTAMLSKCDQEVRELSTLFYQFVIWLIYGKASKPVTLMIRINQTMTTIAIVKITGKNSNHHLEHVIIKTLTKPENELLLLGNTDQSSENHV